MNQFLGKVYADEHVFVPYSMKKKFPQAVARAIQKQNKCIKETWVVILIRITREMMPQLELKQKPMEWLVSQTQTGQKKMDAGTS
jgi:hypothetical protein